MPPWIVAALPVVLAALATAIGGALLVGPFALPLYFRTLKRIDLDRIRAAAKGATFIVADLVKRTPIGADDDLPKVLDMIVAEVEKELGRRAKDDEVRVIKGVAKAMHANPAIDVRLKK